MAPLSKLTLTSYRRTQPHRDPVEERRSKTLAALEQQKLVLAVLSDECELVSVWPKRRFCYPVRRPRHSIRAAVRLCLK